MYVVRDSGRPYCCHHERLPALPGQSDQTGAILAGDLIKVTQEADVGDTDAATSGCRLDTADLGWVTLLVRRPLPRPSYRRQVGARASVSRARADVPSGSGWSRRVSSRPVPPTARDRCARVAISCGVCFWHLPMVRAARTLRPVVKLTPHRSADKAGRARSTPHGRRPAWVRHPASARGQRMNRGAAEAAPQSRIERRQSPDPNRHATPTPITRHRGMSCVSVRRDHQH